MTGNRADDEQANGPNQRLGRGVDSAAVQEDADDSGPGQDDDDDGKEEQDEDAAQELAALLGGDLAPGKEAARESGDEDEPWPEPACVHRGPSSHHRHHERGACSVDVAAGLVLREIQRMSAT